ncbi:hypothetical protein B0H17DRAFT_1218968 [Mycena rosella]|uniref:Uncharacterized protein n=1 Tax=Mycena rosella TaxID=1033263 RepID=A0AAD7BLF0_MYCRO|nr:hypothetical protein B0H17DRAFT_1218968 [Mycena rosella]
MPHATRPGMLPFDTSSPPLGASPAVARLSLRTSTLYAHPSPPAPHAADLKDSGRLEARLGACESDALDLIERDVRCVERLLACLASLSASPARPPHTPRLRPRPRTGSASRLRALLVLAPWLPYIVLMPVPTALRALVVVGRV